MQRLITALLRILSTEITFFKSNKGNTNISNPADPIPVINQNQDNSSNTNTNISKPADPIPVINQNQDDSSKSSSVQPTISSGVNSNYQIQQEIYEGVKIAYPQISQLGNDQIEQKINTLIKKDALSVLDGYQGNLHQLILDLKYEVKYQGSDFLSIKYLGFASKKGAAYLSNVIYTTTIDLSQQKVVALKELVTVDDNFVEKFNAGKYVPYSASSDLQTQAILERAKGESNQSIKERLNDEQAKYYLTGNSLVVSSEVIHALGDHFELELDYPVTPSVQSTVAGTLNSNYQIQQEIYEGVKIAYPQISQLGNDQIEQKINTLIKKDALSVLDGYQGNLHQLILDLKYEVKYQGSDFLSIKYLGFASKKGAAYLSNVIYTTTIDLAQQKVVALKELVTVDDNFVEKFNGGKYVPYSASSDLQTQAILERAKTESNQSIKERFNNDQAKYYLTGSSLVVSSEVIHALGDHFELELDYPVIPSVQPTVAGTLNSNYQIQQEIYEGVKIAYPQISQLGNDQIEQKINTLIKKDALSVLDGYQGNLHQLILDLKYEVKYQGSDFLSIKYLGFASKKGAAYLSNVIYTTTIDLAQQKVVALKELVTVDDNFVEKFNGGKYVPYSASSDLQTQAILERAKTESNQSIKERLNNDQAKYYLTGNSLVVSSEVIHALGDHFELELDYPVTPSVQPTVTGPLNSNYQIQQEIYEGVKIAYPQISQLGNDQIEQKINTLIKKDALSVLDGYQGNLHHLILDLKYEVKYQGSDFLSIKYVGFASKKGAAYLSNVIYTTTIDLAQQKVVALKELVTVDDNFVEKFNGGKYVPYSASSDLQTQAILERAKTESNQSIKERLNNDQAKYYLTGSSLVVSSEVIHALGDHFELELDYPVAPSVQPTVTGPLNSNYQIQQEIYEGVKIAYPQISQLGNDQIEQKINTLIKKDALSVLDGYQGNLHQLILDLKYEVKYQGSDFLSIKYLGFASKKGAAYLSNVIYTTTIDLAQQKVVALKELVTVDDNFVEKFNGGKYVPYSASSDLQTQAILERAKAESNQSIKERLNDEQAKYYLTGNSLVVSSEVIHALGDHFELELDYPVAPSVQPTVTGPLNSNYQIQQEIYEGVKIAYPQISQLGNDQIEQKINTLIKKDALSVLDGYQGNLHHLILDLKYEVKYQGSDFLSIKYLGFASKKGAAYLSNVIYTTTIDLAQQKVVALKELVTVDDNFVEKFNGGKYVPYSASSDLQTQAILERAKAESNQSIKERLNDEHAKYYLTGNSLVVSSEVIHALGDHFELELDYPVTPSVQPSVTGPLNSNYQIQQEIYEGVKITYPQISQLGNDQIEQKINTLIKKDALSVLDGYHGNLHHLILDLKYEVKYQGSDFLSIKYLGFASKKGAAYLSNVIYTTTIDLAQQKVVALKELVTVDDNFVEKFNAGKYVPYSASSDLQTQAILERAKAESNQSIKERLNDEQAKYYLTGNSLVVSSEVIHALGDHFELELDYPVTPSVQSTVAGTLNSNYQIQQEIYEGVKIAYPQISQLGNDQLERKINTLIKKDALSVLDGYQGNLHQLILDLKYEVKYQGSDFLSIKYLGFASKKGAAYLSNVIYTTTIDLAQQKVVALKELVTVDDNFVEKFNGGKYVPYSASSDLQTQAILERAKAESNQSIKERFNDDQAKYYLTGSSLVVSSEVIHALGDHFELELDYPVIPSVQSTVTSTLNSNYQIQQEIYEGVKIAYPQISQLGNDQLERKINTLIKKDALSILDGYQGNLHQLILDLKYEVKYQGSDFLSIKYLGFASKKGAAYLSNVIYTTTIDLAQQKVVALKELVTVDDNFVEKFNGGKYVPYSASSDLQTQAILERAKGESNQSIKERLNDEQAKYYLTGNSLVVSSEVIHALGDHFELELDYPVAPSVQPTVTGPLNSNYQIQQEIYEGVKIAYPQISQLGNDQLERKINTLIKKDALSVLDGYQGNLHQLILDLKYEVKYQGSDFLSIKYLGFASKKGAAYLSNVIYTTTIDLAQQKVVALKELVTVDDNFVEKFNAGKYVPYSASSDLQTQAILERAKGESNQSIKERLNDEQAKYYLTGNSLVVSSEVIHALGDHFELELDYPVIPSVQPTVIGTLNSNYQIQQEIYEGVKIAYPQISQLGNDQLERKINTLIKKDALSILDGYQGNLHQLILDLKYEVKYQGSDFLSIKYLGFASKKGAAYLSNVIYTTTIDLAQQKVVALKELVTVDDNFVEKFNGGKYVPYSASSDLQTQAILERAKAESNQSIKERFNGDQAKYYLTGNSLVVSNEVIHALGDHFELELDYPVVKK